MQLKVVAGEFVEGNHVVGVALYPLLEKANSHHSSVVSSRRGTRRRSVCWTNRVRRSDSRGSVSTGGGRQRKDRDQRKGDWIEAARFHEVVRPDCVQFV